MTIEENKKMAENLFEKFSANAIDDMMALMNDDATWWVSGKPHQFRASGPKTKEEMRGLLKDFFLGQVMVDGMVFTIQGITAEGDRVALEVEGHGDTATGLHYHNEYHFLLEFENGKIQKVKEYLDTIHAREAFEGVS